MRQSNSTARRTGTTGLEVYTRARVAIASTERMQMPTFGVNLPVGVAATAPDELRTLAQQAEQCGFDSVWFADHIVIPTDVQSAYPYAVDGTSTFDPDSPMQEVLSTLGFLPGCRER